MAYTNLQIAELLRKMAAAYQILNENRFKIIAYERAADSVEHLTSEVKDLYDDNKLGEIPGVGATIVGHLTELFKTGHVRHFDSVMKRVPKAVFPLLGIPGIGPKRAYTLVKTLGLNDEKTAVEDLKKAAKKGKIAPLAHFGDKSQTEIVTNIESYKKGSIKENRITLAEADLIAQKLIDHMNGDRFTKRVDILGSLRRQVATIGDIDLAVVTTKPEATVGYFCGFPHEKLIEKGPTGASLRLHNGRQVDLRIADAKSYGAMLQYFTGSKNHNISLRTYALTKGLSLSEYGIKKMSNKSIVQFDTEEKFYKYLGLDYIEPELREDKGEITAARNHTLPHLVGADDIRGDFHIHTSYDLEPSHDLGANTIEEVLDTAAILGYEYIGISDHNPSIGNHTDRQIIEIMKKRRDFYQSHREKWQDKHTKDIHLFIMLEVDIQPDGKLAFPEAAFDSVDGIIASIHSSFSLSKADMTKRILSALTVHPKIKILGHPTGRLLGKREGYDADWKEIFAACKKHDIALEINASPYRLDLPDALIFDAVANKNRLIINTDAHATREMALMKYGVSAARRGWTEKRDIINTMPYNEIEEWFKK